MALPKAVQRQLDEAEAIGQALMEPQEAQPAPVADPQPAPQPTPEPTPTPTPAVDETLEHKFRTLQGMFNAERAQNKVYESKLAALMNQMAAMTAQLEKQNSSQPEPPKAPETDPRDSAQFGEDLVEMVQRYVTRAMTALRSDLGTTIAEFDKRVKALEAVVNGVSQKTEMSLEQAFYAALEQAVPDWRRINTSDAWLRWLEEHDEIYGATRQEALDAAHKALNAKRVIAIFKAFLASAQAAKPSLDAQRTPEPRAAATPAASATPVARTITQKLIKQFYDDLARGKYRGREAEAERLQAEIDKAAMEGRIV